ncbi:hypothetical protein [Streptomyces sp. Act143]|uniref:hypothetical protein n=1 Tax=Streptomyces sp. Act143 TaxID=2200760 RepID=UPI0011B380C6|nr:hypothetical protein [Streptomyces sp. Act143]
MGAHLHTSKINTAAERVSGAVAASQERNVPMLLAARPAPTRAPRVSFDGLDGLDGLRAVPAPRRGDHEAAGPAVVTGAARPPAPSPPRCPDPGAPPGTRSSDVLRIIRDSDTPVFLTVRANRPPRYGYWLPAGRGARGGGCWVALPTAVCEELREAGRIVLGEPVVDPTKTTYRVTRAAPARQTDTQGRRAA